MNAKLRYCQFSLGSVLVSLTTVAVVLAASSYVNAARENARRTTCLNTVRQHSGFHGLGCDVCKSGILNVIGTRSTGSVDTFRRLEYIAIATTCKEPDDDIVTALQIASESDIQSIRTAASRALVNLQLTWSQLQASRGASAIGGNNTAHSTE